MIIWCYFYFIIAVIRMAIFIIGRIIIIFMIIRIVNQYQWLVMVVCYDLVEMYIIVMMINSIRLDQVYLKLVL
jgi:hypothetical protein